MGSFTKTGTNGKKFIVFTPGMDDKIDSFVENMISKNHIRHSLGFSTVNNNGAFEYRYNVAGLKPLSIICEYNMSLRRNAIIGLVKTIVESIIDAEEYMLDVVNVSWNFEHIFLDEHEHSVKLMYLPIIADEIEFSLRKFLEALMNSLIPDPSEVNNYFVEIQTYIKTHNDGNFVYKDFLVFLNKLGKPETPANPVYSRPAEPAPYIEPQPVKEVLVEKPVQEIKQEKQEDDFTPVEVKEIVVKETEDAQINSSKKQGLLKKLGFGGINETKKEKPAKEPKAKKNPFKDEVDDMEDDPFGLFGDSFAPAKKPEKKEEKKPEEEKSVDVKKKIMGGFSLKPDKQSAGSKKEAIDEKPVVKPAPRQQYSFDIPDEQNRQGTVYISNSSDGGRRTGTIMKRADDVGEVQVFLLRVKNNERIHLKNSPFIIGRYGEGTNWSYPVFDNGHISSPHARIDKNGDDYFITDLDSTNGTTVNRRDISGDKIRLNPDDKVVLADEEFIFKVE